MKVRVRTPKRARMGQGVGVDSFPDVPGCIGVRWQGSSLEVEFDRDLTAAEQQVVADRCESTTATEETLRGQVRAYLALKSPNAKDREEAFRALIRLQLDDDGTD